MKIHNRTSFGFKLQVRKVWITSDSTCYTMRPSYLHVEHSIRLRKIRGGRNATWWLESDTGEVLRSGIRTIAEGIDAAGVLYAYGKVK